MWIRYRTALTCCEQVRRVGRVTAELKNRSRNNSMVLGEDQRQSLNHIFGDDSFPKA